MPLNKPDIGQANWGPILNNALDYLDEKASSAETAGFTFDTVDDDNEESRMTVANHDMVIRTTRTGTQDADIDIDSADDVWITANDELELSSITDEVRVMTDDGSNTWSFQTDGGIRFPDNTVQTTAYTGDPVDTGDITFDGVQIIGYGEGSGDGNGYGTIELVPDANRQEFDQYLIVDPTVPNHIHLRAGGDQDASNAELIVGGEKTNVKVVDNSGQVHISTSSENYVISLTNENTEPSSTFTTSSNVYLYNVIGEGWEVSTLSGDTAQLIGSNSPGDDIVTFSVAEENFFVPDETYYFNPNYGNDGDTQWTFAPDGALYGPAMGAVKLTNIININPGDGLGMFAQQGILNLSGDNELSLNSDSGDIYLNADGGVYVGNSNNSYNEVARVGDLGEDTPFTVAGGTLGTQPTFTGAPLFTGSYVKTGPMVHFRIDVDMDNITSFGTGQYYVDLPFPAKYNYLLRNACLHDVSMPRQYGLSGHVEAGQSRMLLFYTDTSGQDYAFDYNSPALLTVNDNFHISGDYVIAD
jgi:hypothetical protein